MLFSDKNLNITRVTQHNPREGINPELGFFQLGYFPGFAGFHYIQLIGIAFDQIPQVMVIAARIRKCCSIRRSGLSPSSLPLNRVSLLNIFAHQLLSSDLCVLLLNYIQRRMS